jgi:hypothetical protein
MEDIKHGFFWKLTHLSFGKSDEAYASDELARHDSDSAEKGKQVDREMDKVITRSRKTW